MEAQQKLVDELHDKKSEIQSQLSEMRNKRESLLKQRKELLAGLKKGTKAGEQELTDDVLGDYVVQSVISYYSLCEADVDVEKLHLLLDDVIIPLLNCIEQQGATYPKIRAMLQTHYSSTYYPKVYNLLARHLIANFDIAAPAADDSCLSAINILLIMNDGRVTDDVAHVLLSPVAKRISFHFKRGSALLPQMFVLCSQWFQECLSLLALVQPLVGKKENVIHSCISWMYRQLLATFKRIGLQSSLYTGLLGYEEEQRVAFHYPETSYHVSPALFSEQWLEVERMDAFSSFTADKANVLILFQSLVNTRLALLLDPQHKLMYFTEVLQPILNHIIDHLDEYPLSTVSFYQQAFEEWALQPHLPTQHLTTVSEICASHISGQLQRRAEQAYDVLEEHGNQWLYGNRLVRMAENEGNLSSEFGASMIHLRGLFKDTLEEVSDELYVKFLLVTAKLFDAKLFHHFCNVTSFAETSGKQLQYDLNAMFSLWRPQIKTPAKLFKSCADMLTILSGSFNFISAVRYVDKIEDKDQRRQMLDKYGIQNISADQVVQIATLREDCV